MTHQLGEGARPLSVFPPKATETWEILCPGASLGCLPAGGDGQRKEAAERLGALWGVPIPAAWLWPLDSPTLEASASHTRQSCGSRR